jgi:hypothetical protein
MSFQTDIEAYTGSITDEATEAPKFLRDAVKFIIKIIMLDKGVAERLSATSRLSTTNGVTLDLANVLKINYITRFDGTRDKIATETSPQFAAAHEDENSIYFTNEFDPKYYIKDNILHVIPEPSNAQPADVRAITPDPSVALGDTAIAGLPDEFYDGVVYHASRNILLKRIVSADEDVELSAWYEQQYQKVHQLLMEFLEPYIVGKAMTMGGGGNETATNARTR